MQKISLSRSSRGTCLQTQHLSSLIIYRYSGWSEGKRKVVSVPSSGVEHISGVDLLSNDAVNVLSAALTSFVVGFYYYM